MDLKSFRFEMVQKLQGISFEFPYITSKYSVISPFSDVGIGSSIGLDL